MEEFGEKIKASTGAGKEIAGSKKKRRKNMYKHDSTKIMKSHVGGFSRAKLEASRNRIGLGIARDESKYFCCVFSRPSYAF